jgi:aminopeptidase N
MNATGAGGDPYFPEFGDRAYAVAHYDLQLVYRIEGNHLSGTAGIRAVAREALQVIRLDLHGLDVSKVRLDVGHVAKFSCRHGKLVVRTKKPIAAGQEFCLTVRYDGRPQQVSDGSDGMGWEELADGVLVAGQTNGAPSWFPCNDRPDDKASYRIEVTAASRYHVVANGHLASKRRGAGSTTWVYEQSEPMATYLATVQIGPYVSRDLPGAPVPMTAVLPEERLGGYDSGFGRLADMMAYFAEVFGPYPFGSYAVVITDDELEIPLEAQGLAIFGSNFLTDDWQSVRLVAHELAHQWFGNSVTASSWRDIWLHEGFACYAEWLWSERSGGPSAAQRAREHHVKLVAKPQDLLLGDPGPQDMFDDRVYKRGALLLHALRVEVGEDTFFAILREWTARFRHGSVTTAMFIELAEEVAGRGLVALFRAWLGEVAVPALA